jgi:hypothetical protein
MLDVNNVYRKEFLLASCHNVKLLGGGCCGDNANADVFFLKDGLSELNEYVSISM